MPTRTCDQRQPAVTLRRVLGDEEPAVDEPLAGGPAELARNSATAIAG